MNHVFNFSCPDKASHSENIVILFDAVSESSVYWSGIYWRPGIY